MENFLIDRDQDGWGLLGHVQGRTVYIMHARHGRIGKLTYSEATHEMEIKASKLLTNYGIAAPRTIAMRERMLRRARFRILEALKPLFAWGFVAGLARPA